MTKYLLEAGEIVSVAEVGLSFFQALRSPLAVKLREGLSRDAKEIVDMFIGGSSGIADKRGAIYYANRLLTLIS